LALLERGRARGLARQLAFNQAQLSDILSESDRAQLRTRTDELNAASARLRGAKERLARA